MKFVFANEERKGIILSLINSVLELEGENPLVDFDFRDRELDPVRLGDKESQLDVLGRCADGTIVNVEVQLEHLEAMGKRSLFYWARLYRLGKGEQYEELPRTICINILACDLFDIDQAPDFHSCFALLDIHNPKHRLTTDLEIHFIELPKWESQRDAIKNFRMIDKWLAYFSKKTPTDKLEEIAMQEPVIREALAAENIFMSNPDLVTAYDQLEKARMDRAARETYLLRVGKEEGIKQGIEQGIEQGIMRGIEQEQLKNIANMQGMKFSEDQIAAVLGLHIDEVRKLVAKLTPTGTMQ